MDKSRIIWQKFINYIFLVFSDTKEYCPQKEDCRQFFSDPWLVKLQLCWEKISRKSNMNTKGCMLNHMRDIDWHRGHRALLQCPTSSSSWPAPVADHLPMYSQWEKKLKVVGYWSKLQICSSSQPLSIFQPLSLSERSCLYQKRGQKMALFWYWQLLSERHRGWETQGGLTLEQIC